VRVRAGRGDNKKTETQKRTWEIKAVKTKKSKGGGWGGGGGITSVVLKINGRGERNQKKKILGWEEKDKFGFIQREGFGWGN